MEAVAVTMSGKEVPFLIKDDLTASFEESL